MTITNGLKVPRLRRARKQQAEPKPPPTKRKPGRPRKGSNLIDKNAKNRENYRRKKEQQKTAKENKQSFDSSHVKKVTRQTRKPLSSLLYNTELDVALKSIESEEAISF